MPNGGPDCCGNCSHNRAVQELAHPQPERPAEFWERSRCTLRDVAVTNPFWTYCRNFTYGKHPEARNTTDIPVGWITASGLYEGYVRISWHGQIEPEVSVPTQCSVCGWGTEKGISIAIGDSHLGFCANRHYIQWWRTVHDDATYDPEDYESPEERYAKGRN
ncbi:MAG: hypothetical protein K0Q76_3825 [Panacagrimonas sp.]|nr:hypothetical protein [Panacagrimonas sp.]